MGLFLHTSILFSLLVAHQTLAQLPAPQDHDAECRLGLNRANHIFPEEWELLLDTYDYFQLFNPSSTRSVWKSESFDGDNNRWRQVVGGTCTWSLYSCSSRSSIQPQDNWLFSQYVSYESANEIFFNVSYSFSQCRGNPACDRDYVSLYIYNTDGMVEDTDRRNTDNYQPLFDNEESSRLQQPPFPIRGVSETLSFLRPQSGSKGFYLGVRDTGTCGLVSRMILYYTVCHARQSGLVEYPQTATPPKDGPASVFDAKCVDNAHNVTSLQVKAFGENNTCIDVVAGGARCECNEGYTISDDQESCRACGQGFYRALGAGSLCQQCPQNTLTNAIAASYCECLPGFFRTDTDGKDRDCTSSPDPVRDLSTERSDSNSITVSWEKPENTGRNDYYYQIIATDTNLEVVHAKDNFINTADTVEYTVPGLKPVTIYIISVVTHNGVSDQDSTSEGHRTVQVRGSTGEGVPGVPIVDRLCTVVIWRPPTEPAGQIIRYELRFGQSDARIVTFTSEDNFYITTDAERSLNEIVEMRAINSLFSSVWTEPLPLDCFNMDSDFDDDDSDTTRLSAPCESFAAPTNGRVSVAVTYSCDDGYVLDGPQTSTCSGDGTLSSRTPTCVRPCQLPYFMLGGLRYENNSEVSIDALGRGQNGIHTITEFQACCRTQRIGEFYYPDDSLVGRSNAGEPLFRDRGQQFVRINRRNGQTSAGIPLGRYRSKIPDACGNEVSLYITIV